jgi:hypothetical protein
MSNRNKTTRTVLRWTHLLVGFLIGVFVYTPAHDNDAFVLLMQTAVVPAVTVTVAWMWQHARIRRLYRRLRRNPRHGRTHGPTPPEEMPGRTTVLQPSHLVRQEE